MPARRTHSSLLALVLVTLSVGEARATTNRPGEKDTLRVPAGRTQLVETLLERTAEADARAADAPSAPAVRPARAAVAVAPVADEAVAPTRVHAAPPADFVDEELPLEDAAAPVAPPKAALPEGKPSSGPTLGSTLQLALLAGGLLLLVGVVLRRRKVQSTMGLAPANLRVLGKAALGSRWQVSLLELPDEVLVLGAGETGVRVLARINDPEKIAALQQSQSTGAGGFGRLLKNLVDRPRAEEQASSPPSPRSRRRPTRDEELGDDPGPAEILAAERALELHRALRGEAARESGRPAADSRELLELELMKQRLADLRAGRFAQ